MRLTTMNVKNQINARAQQLGASNRVNFYIKNENQPQPTSMQNQEIDIDKISYMLGCRLARDKRGLTTYDDDD